MNVRRAFTEQNTNQATISATYAAVTGASISTTQLDDAGIAVGADCLLLITANMNNTTQDIDAFLRVLHGVTAFAESEMIYRPSNASIRSQFAFLVKWTRITGEAISMEFHSDGTNTANVNHISMIALNLADMPANSFYYAERGTDDALSTTPVNGASITQTLAAGTWLVATFAQMNPGDATTQMITKIVRSGEAADSAVSAQFEARNIANQLPMMLASIYTAAGGQSNTFTEQSSASSGTAHVRLFSSLFALNLSVFLRSASARTDADLALVSATNYGTEIQTATITPLAVGDVMILCYFGSDVGNASRETEYRLQIDDVDVPAGQTTANYQFGPASEALNEIPYMLSTIANLSAAAHVLAVDGSCDSDVPAAPNAQHRMIAAFTLELKLQAGVLSAAGVASSALVGEATVGGPAPAGTVPVRVSSEVGAVPTETVVTNEAGVVPVRTAAAAPGVVPIRNAPTEVPRVKIRQV